MVLFLLFVGIMSGFCPHPGGTDPLHAYCDGDIMIGGLFPIHRKTDRNITNDTLPCSEFDPRTFLHSQVMIYAIREINQRTPRILPNFTLGYEIYDTCGDVGNALRAVLRLLRSQSDPQNCSVLANLQSVLPEPKTKAVIGERHSEVSIAVARVLALSSVAQVSHASTSELLSRKSKFPTFLRTISSDEYQTQAIAELVKKFNWQTVVIIGSDDEYGKYGSDRLNHIFSNMPDVCVEFVEILPDFFSENSSEADKKLDELVSNINNSSAEAIIVFTKNSNVDKIMGAAISHKLNRTWIASDTWSTSTSISSRKNIEMAGEVFGFISKRNEVPGFEDYVMSMFNGTTNAILDHYFTMIHHTLCSNQSEQGRESNSSKINDQQGSKQCLKDLAKYIDQDESYNIYLAAHVIAEGLRNLLKCNNHQCERDARFTALELFFEIKRVNFTVNKTHIFFNRSGDPSLGYDIVHWTQSKQGTCIDTIGEYWPKGEIKVPNELVDKMRSVTVTAYNCSKTCERGYELKLQKQCCRGCFQCAQGQFSVENGTECQNCDQNSYSSLERDKCWNKSIEFFEWSDPLNIILTSLAVLGIIVTIVFAVLFMLYRTTPIVKAVGGYLCFLELFSLLTCFCLTFNFTGIPNNASCMVGLPFFGIAFSLCISCILANLLQILVGFSFDLKIGSWIKKLNQPIAVVAIVFGIQLAICVPWLCLHPPHAGIEILSEVILHECKIGSIGFFAAMLGYNAGLALICFLFAFKGKQLPDLYKNASLVTTSMLLYLIIWILFIPIYISLFGKYKRAIESAAILISSYSILGCHLAPKCYIMLFRKEINNENAITEYIRKHYEQSNMAVVK